MKIWIKWILIIGFLATLAFLSTGCHKPIAVSPQEVVAAQPNYNSVVTQLVYKTNWIMTISLLGFGVGVFGFINGSKVALAAIGASLASIVLSLTIAQHSYWLATAGLITAIGLGVYTVLVKTKAIRQLIIGIQHVRHTNDDREGLITNTIALEQDKETKEIVEQEKELLKAKRIIY